MNVTHLTQIWLWLELLGNNQTLPGPGWNWTQNSKSTKSPTRVKTCLLFSMHIAKIYAILHHQYMPFWHHLCKFPRHFWPSCDIFQLRRLMLYYLQDMEKTEVKTACCGNISGWCIDIGWHIQMHEVMNFKGADKSRTSGWSLFCGPDLHGYTRPGCHFSLEMLQWVK